MYACMHTHVFMRDCFCMYVVYIQRVRIREHSHVCTRAVCSRLFQHMQNKKSDMHAYAFFCSLCKHVAYTQRSCYAKTRLQNTHTVFVFVHTCICTRRTHTCTALLASLEPRTLYYSRCIARAQTHIRRLCGWYKDQTSGCGFAEFT